MKEMVRCKACGYLMEKDALGEVCPACGVKKEMFEPWEDKVGALRRFYLEKHLHPVVVHAPQALTFLLLILGVLFPLFPAPLQSAYLWPAIVVMTWLLPISLVATIVTGFMDAMVRYRKVATPALLQKQILGYLFLVASVVMVVVVTTGNFGSLVVWCSFVVANLVAMATSALLGLKGAKLTHAAMPGDKIFMKKKKPAAKKAPAKAEAPKAPEEKKE
jgi:uncharacterized membrane protein/rubredoxin